MLREPQKIEKNPEAVKIQRGGADTSGYEEGQRDGLFESICLPNVEIADVYFLPSVTISIGYYRESLYERGSY